MTQSLEQAVQAMTKLLIEENQALAEMNFARAGALLAPKHAAADALAAAWRSAADTEAPPADLVKLGELAEENRRLLNRAMRVQRRVLDLVAKAARNAQTAPRYGSSGRVANGRGTPRSLLTRI
jgi:mevalonate kinase